MSTLTTEKTELVVKQSFTLKAPADAWLRALRILDHTQVGTPPVPILGAVIVEAVAGYVELSATNYELTLRADVIGAVAEKDVRFAVSMRGLAHLIRTAMMGKSSTEITVELHEYTDRSVAIVDGSGYRLPTTVMPVDDYPELDTLKQPATFTINAAAWNDAVRRVAVASSKDRTLPMLTSIQVEIEKDKIRLSATDRYRATYARLDIQKTRATAKFLLNGETWLKLARHSKGSKLRVVVGDEAEKVKFIFDEFTVIVTPFQVGEYPPLEKLIADHYPNALTVNRAELIAAANVALRLSQRYGARVDLIASPGKLEVRPDLSSYVDDFTRSSLRVPPIDAQLDRVPVPGAEYDEPPMIELSEMPFKFSFSPTYFLDALKVIEGSEVTLHFGHHMAKPFVLTTAGIAPHKDAAMRYLLMPVRMSGN